MFKKIDKIIKQGRLTRVLKMAGFTKNKKRDRSNK